MKIVIAKPPVWEEANKLFKLEQLGLGVIFTYGDTIYNPFNIVVTADLIAHESVHAEQQEHNETCAKLWWKRYIADPAFRVSQEGAAYHAQYKCICRQHKDRNARARWLHTLSTQFSGPFYDKAVTHSDAMKLIRDGVKIPAVKKEVEDERALLLQPTGSEDRQNA